MESLFWVFAILFGGVVLWRPRNKIIEWFTKLLARIDQLYRWMQIGLAILFTILIVVGVFIFVNQL